MQYSAAQGYFSPEIAQFFRLFAAHPFRTRPQPLTRSECGHIVQRIAQTNELRSARARFCHVGSIVSNAPAAVDALRVRAHRPTHRRSITEQQAGRARFCHVGSIVSNAPAAVDALRARTYRPTHRRSITEQQAARARFCHVGSIVSNAPAAVDALGARAHRPTHRPKPTNCDQSARDIAMPTHLGAASLVRRFAALATPSTAVSAPSAATNALASRRRLSALSGSAVRASITSAESAAWTSFQ